MSDLKHLSLLQLLYRKRECEQYIGTLNSKIGGENERLKWINKYIDDKEREIEQSKIIPYFKSFSYPCIMSNEDFSTIIIAVGLSEHNTFLSGYILSDNNLRTGDKFNFKDYHKFKKYDKSITLKTIPPRAETEFFLTINKLNMQMYLNKEVI